MSSLKDDLQDLQRLVCKKLLEEIRKDRPGGQDVPPALIGQAIHFLEMNRTENLPDRHSRSFLAAQGAIF